MSQRGGLPVRQGEVHRFRRDTPKPVKSNHKLAGSGSAA